MSLKEEARRIFKGAKRRVAREVLERTIQIRERKIENLQPVIDYLPYGSVIDIWDHMGTPDPYSVMRKRRERFGNAIKRLIIPGSMKFVDGRLGDQATYMMKVTADKYEVEVLPTMQHNDPAYTDEEKYKHNRGVMDKMITALQEPGTLVSLAPNGTRSRTRLIETPPNGITTLIRKSPNALVSPLGLWGSEKTLDLNLRYNPFAPIYFSYGVPISTEQIIWESKTYGIPIRDIAMLHIAYEVPEEYRGVYEYDKYRDFYDAMQMTQQ